ncbi:MAG TPA: hypothetical protein VLX92_13665 [Kofleriaceae bacterium]|nr:hypothetical protein [Kofleriaceae bacterium]
MVRWIAGLLVVASVTARAETIDIASFAPPAGWQRAAKPGSVAYSTARGQTFALFVVFASVPGSGDADRDFAAAWRDLVGGPSHVAAPAQPIRTRTQQGQAEVVGAAQTIDQGARAVTLVAVIEAGGRVVRVLAKTNAQDAMPVFDSLLATIAVAGAAAAPARPPAAAGLDDIELDAPPGYTAQRTADGIVLTEPTGRCTLDILGTRASGASLEADADAAFAELFGGWNHKNDDGPYQRMSRGVSADGWEFLKVESYLWQHANGGPDPFAKTELFGFVMVARLDGVSVVIGGSRKDSSAVKTLGGLAQCLDDYLTTDWTTFFRGLHFKAWKPRHELASHLVGTWHTTAMNVAIRLAFAANGHYRAAYGSDSARQVDPATVEVTTRGYFGEGTYKLDGDTLTLVPDHGKPQIKHVRWQMTWQLGTWQEELFVQDPPTRAQNVEPIFHRDK